MQSVEGVRVVGGVQSVEGVRIFEVMPVGELCCVGLCWLRQL